MLTADAGDGDRPEVREGDCSARVGAGASRRSSIALLTSVGSITSTRRSYPSCSARSQMRLINRGIPAEPWNTAASAAGVNSAGKKFGRMIYACELE